MKRQRLGGKAVEPDAVDIKEELKPVSEPERRLRDLVRLKAQREFADDVVTRYAWAALQRAGGLATLNEFEVAILVQCDNAIIEWMLTGKAKEFAYERRAELRAITPPLYV